MFGAMLSAASSYCGSDPTLEETPMKSITRLVIAVVAVMFAVATLCPAQDVKPTDLVKGAAFNGKKIEMKDKGEVAYLQSFTAYETSDARHTQPNESLVAPSRLYLSRP